MPAWTTQSVFKHPLGRPRAMRGARHIMPNNGRGIGLTNCSPRLTEHFLTASPPSREAASALLHRSRPHAKGQLALLPPHRRTIGREFIRVPARKGILCTIAAVHQERNQVIAISRKRHDPLRQCTAGDVINIKCLPMLRVRKIPFIDLAPNPAAPYICRALGYEADTAGRLIAAPGGAPSELTPPVR
jgi:hypothetical protein